MNETVASNRLKWADALESGKYKQHRDGWGRGHRKDMRLKEGFCCLHVAIDCMGLSHEEALHNPLGTFQKWFKINFGENHLKFVIMNDEKKMSFVEIASEVRKGIK